MIENKFKKRIFCLPYAGGSSSIYKNWKNYFPEYIDIYAIELPGRASRFNEPALNNMPEIINDIIYKISENLDIPFIFFGHSMGAVISLELTKKLINMDKKPERLIVSGCGAPYLPLRREYILNLLPNEELIIALKKMGGLPEIAFSRPDFLETFLPTIRADLECRENWISDCFNLEIPINVLIGENDFLVNEKDARAWSNFTSSSFSLKKFNGNHFFITSSTQEVTNYIMSQLI